MTSFASWLRRRQRKAPLRWLWGSPLAVLSLLQAPGAHAATEPTIWMDLSGVLNGTVFLFPQPVMLGAGLDWHWAEGFEASAGLRWSPTPALVLASGVEAFGAVSLAPVHGAWRPAIGLELGLTSLATVEHPEVARSGFIDPGIYFSEGGALSPVYLSLTSRPLRFQVGSMTLSALALSLGTHWPDAGRVARIQVIPLQLGWRL